MGSITDLWEGFFNPQKIIAALGMNKEIGDVVEFGCGYGTFTIPVAKAISGTVYALDIDPDMLQITRKESLNHGMNNVKAILRDFMVEGSGLPEASVDYTMLFNILHLENPTALLCEAKRILKNGGKVGIIHWNYDPKTPRGPSMAIRPKPDDCVKWAESVGFIEPKLYDLKPYHYGIVLIKENNEPGGR